MKILVGVDGSKYSKEAVSWAVRIAKTEKNCEIIAVYIDKTSSKNPEPFADDLGFDKSNSVFRHSFEDVDLSGIKVTTIVEKGSPASKILEIADREDVDLIVVGSRGTSGVSKFFLGSVSDKIFTYSVRPVLVVKIREEEPAFETVAIT